MTAAVIGVIVVVLIVAFVLKGPNLPWSGKDSGSGSGGPYFGDGGRAPDTAAG